MLGGGGGAYISVDVSSGLNSNCFQTILAATTSYSIRFITRDLAVIRKAIGRIEYSNAYSGEMGSITPLVIRTLYSNSPE